MTDEQIIDYIQTAFAEKFNPVEYSELYVLIVSEAKKQLEFMNEEYIENAVNERLEANDEIESRLREVIESEVKKYDIHKR